MQYLIDDALRGSPTAARRLEDEIERRGLQHEYLNYLVDLDPNISTRVDEVFTTFNGLWVILRATPEQRARAFLAVMEAA